jgi:hypothetical protein
MAFNYYIGAELRKPMATLANVLSFTSGFALMGFRETPANLIATSIAIDLALAPLTAVVASRRGRSTIGWAVAGVLLGAWALAAVMIMPAANRPATPRADGPQFPPTSDAA